MHKMLGGLLVLLCTGSLSAQIKKVSWGTLQDITYNEKYVPAIKGYMLFPEFPAVLSRLNGTMVDIPGYVIPMDKTGMRVVLSANPYASCYFCGGGSPASVMTVMLKTKNTRYALDDYKVFRGRLRLNADDYNEFYFVLELAEEAPR